MSGFGCDEITYGYVVPLIMMNISVCIVIWFIFIYSMCQVYRSDLKINVKIIAIITAITLVMVSTGSSICVIRFFVCPTNRLDNDFYLSSVIVTSLETVLALIMLQMLFTVRFIDAFVDSLLEVSNRLKYTLYTFSFIETTFFILFVIFSAIFTFSDNAMSLHIRISLICNYSMLLAYLIHFVILMKNFIIKLKQFAALCSDSHAQQTRKHIYCLVNRLFVCWVFAFTITVIFYICFGLLRFVFSKLDDISQEYTFTPLVFTMANIDACVNLFVLILQFDFATRIYFKVCSKCDKHMKLCCDRCGQNKQNSGGIRMQIEIRTGSPNNENSGA